MYSITVNLETFVRLCFQWYYYNHPPNNIVIIWWVTLREPQ